MKCPDCKAAPKRVTINALSVQEEQRSSNPTSFDAGASRASFNDVIVCFTSLGDIFSSGIEPQT